MRIYTSTIALLGLASTATFAAEKKAEIKDSERKICQKQSVVGSRLATRRVCLTEAQWRAKRLDDRQALEQTQAPETDPNGQ